MRLCYVEFINQVVKNGFLDNIKSFSSWTWNLSSFSLIIRDLYFSSCVFYILFNWYQSISFWERSTNINGIMSLISNSNYSFLCMGKQFAFVYKSCIMQPCYNHLLSSVLWVFHRQSYHLQTKSFISSFPVCMTLTSFPCLAALGITSSKIMKRNCEGEHPSLVLGLRGKASSFFFFFFNQ